MTQSDANRDESTTAAEEFTTHAAADLEADSAAAKPENSPAESAPIDHAASAALDPAGEIERLEAEKADLTNRLLRLAADMDNLRRRTEREMNDAKRYGATKFAGDMLVVADNLRRAIDAVPDERGETEGALKALLEGVEMTAREMDRLLERNGVLRIAAVGERFDPNRHQAVFDTPSDDVPEGSVVQVMQEGFTIGDRVLRAAMVSVSKGSASSGAQSAAPPSQAGESGVATVA